MGSDKYRAAIVKTVKVNSDNLNQLPARKLRTFLLLNTGSFAFPQMIGGLTLEQRSTISEELSQSSSQLSVRTASLDIQENCHRFRHYPQRGGVWTRLAKKAGASVPTGIIRPPSLVGGRTVSVKLTPQERQPEKDKSMSREARKIKVINV